MLKLKKNNFIPIGSLPKILEDLLLATTYAQFAMSFTLMVPTQNSVAQSEVRIGFLIGNVNLPPNTMQMTNQTRISSMLLIVKYILHCKEYLIYSGRLPNIYEREW